MHNAYAHILEKTRTAINLICDHLKNNNKLVIWLAHTEELCQQAHDEFNKGWETIEIKKFNHINYLKILDMI